MNLKCINSEVNNSSVLKEIIFCFEISIENFKIFPINFNGILQSSDGKKIGTLQLHPKTSFNRDVKADGVNSRINQNSEIIIYMSCEISNLAFNHIETLRHNTEHNDINFYAILNTSFIETKMQVSSIYFEENTQSGFQKEFSKNVHRLVYSYSGGNYSNTQSDLFLLSTSERENFARICYYQHPNCNIKISYTDWVKIYVPYFNGHSVLVFELPLPPYKYIPKKLQKNYQKALSCLEVMKKHYEKGEWKSLVVEARVIYELFKNLKDFEDVLVNSGYSSQAVVCINDMLKGLFDFISKVHHAYQMHSKNINDDIEINREDAVFIYTNCCALINLISEKSKRLSA